jgi:hypothetical protein
LEGFFVRPDRRGNVGESTFATPYQGGYNRPDEHTERCTDRGGTVNRRQIVIRLVITLAALVMLFAVVLPAAAQSEGRIAGIVYADTNANGIRDEGEPGIKDARVNFASGGWDTTINTADDGSFSIELNPGTWTVTIVELPAGYFEPEVASTEVVVAAAGDAVSNVEFAIVPEGTVLPASGGPVPGYIIIGGLIAMLIAGGALVLLGQRRSQLPV